MVVGVVGNLVGGGGGFGGELVKLWEIPQLNRLKIKIFSPRLRGQ